MHAHKHPWPRLSVRWKEHWLLLSKTSLCVRTMKMFLGSDCKLMSGRRCMCWSCRKRHLSNLRREQLETRPRKSGRWWAQRVFPTLPIIWYSLKHDISSLVVSSHWQSMSSMERKDEKALNRVSLPLTYGIVSQFDHLIFLSRMIRSSGPGTAETHVWWAGWGWFRGVDFGWDQCRSTRPWALIRCSGLVVVDKQHLSPYHSQFSSKDVMRSLFEIAGTEDIPTLFVSRRKTACLHSYTYCGLAFSSVDSFLVLI